MFLAFLCLFLFSFVWFLALRSSHSVLSYDVHCAISSLDYCCSCCCCCCCRRRRRLCRGSKARYLSEQGHVVVVVVGCSTFKHHPTPTSYIKKTPNIIASHPGPAASTSFRYETQDNTHMRPLCAIGAKHAKKNRCL